MANSAEGVWPIRPKWGRPTQQERQLTPNNLAAGMDLLEETLHNVTFPAVLIGRQVEMVLSGNAPAYIIESFKRRCLRVGELAVCANREFEDLRGGVEQQAA